MTCEVRDALVCLADAVGCILFVAKAVVETDSAATLLFVCLAAYLAFSFCDTTRSVYGSF